MLNISVTNVVLFYRIDPKKTKKGCFFLRAAKGKVSIDFDNVQTRPQIAISTFSKGKKGKLYELCLPEC